MAFDFWNPGAPEHHSGAPFHYTTTIDVLMVKPQRTAHELVCMLQDVDEFSLTQFYYASVGFPKWGDLSESPFHGAVPTHAATP